jgi:hypothetical protein
MSDALKEFGEFVRKNKLEGLVLDILKESSSVLCEAIRTDQPDLEASDELLESLHVAEALLDSRIANAANLRDILVKAKEAAVDLVWDAILKKGGLL